MLKGWTSDQQVKSLILHYYATT